jgi:uncharacterized protein YdeI (BOF family)
VRIPQKVWNGQHFDAQDLVRVSGLVSHENGAARLDVGVIMALIYTLMQDAEP